MQKKYRHHLRVRIFLFNNKLSPKKIADYVTQQGYIIEGIRKTNIGYKVDIIGSHTDLFFNHNGDPIGNY